MGTPTKDELREENALLKERLGAIYDELGELLGVEDDEVDEDDDEDFEDD